MIKCRFYIKNENTFCEDTVWVEHHLPVLPQVGNIVRLSEKSFDKLEQLARIDLDTARRYAPKWFYGHSSRCENPKKKNLADLGFTDAQYVTDIVFDCDLDYISIVLDDSPPVLNEYFKTQE